MLVRDANARGGRGGRPEESRSDRRYAALSGELVLVSDGFYG